MFIKLNRINKHLSGEFYISEIRVNASQILFITENEQIRMTLSEGAPSLGLNSMVRFSDVLFASTTGRETITVVGEPALIESKIKSSNKQLLRG
jgi:hypothetical protein